MTADPLTERLALWRKRASTGSYVDGVVRGAYGRRYVDATPNVFQAAASHAALPDIGDETDACPSCGTALVVVGRILPDEVIATCPQSNCLLEIKKSVK